MNPSKNLQIVQKHKDKTSAKGGSYKLMNLWINHETSTHTSINVSNEETLMDPVFGYNSGR